MSAKKRIEKEIKNFVEANIEDVDLIEIRLEKFELDFVIFPRENDLYKGGEFHFTVSFPMDYPFKIPRILFKTKIYHPNICDDGKLLTCCGCSKGMDVQWSPALTTIKVIEWIREELKVPNSVLNLCEEPFGPTARYLYYRDRESFNAKAKEYTDKSIL